MADSGVNRIFLPAIGEIRHAHLRFTSGLWSWRVPEQHVSFTGDLTE